MLRIVDVAAYLGVTHQRVHQLYKLGRLPEPATTDAVGPLWRRGDIEAWAKANWWGMSRTPWRQQRSEA